MTITYQQWGLHRGQAVYLFQLVHQNGGRVQLTNYGASIVSVQAPDRRGQAGEVVLGFASLEGFLQDRCYLGATIGRVANRIAGAQFSLDGIWYTLDANDGVHSNHSGPTGLHGKVFGFRVEDDALLFHTRCADGEGGFPGRLDVTVRYRWSADYRLEISYEAVTSRDTIVNITNHAYFNLSGARGAMLDHTLTIPACRLLEADSAYIPTGRLLPAGRKDFREATRISDKAGPGAYQVKGLNDYYLLDTPAPESRQELAL
ncbi:MAG TPA: aldose epimerase family protein, partial [Chitinophaga sp.]